MELIGTHQFGDLSVSATTIALPSVNKNYNWGGRVCLTGSSLPCLARGCWLLQGGGPLLFSDWTFARSGCPLDLVLACLEVVIKQREARESYLFFGLASEVTQYQFDHILFARSKSLSRTNPPLKRWELDYSFWRETWQGIFRNISRPPEVPWQFHSCIWLVV